MGWNETTYWVWNKVTHHCNIKARATDLTSRSLLPHLQNGDSQGCCQDRVWKVHKNPEPNPNLSSCSTMFLTSDKLSVSLLQSQTRKCGLQIPLFGRAFVSIYTWSESFCSPNYTFPLRLAFMKLDAECWRQVPNEPMTNLRASSHWLDSWRFWSRAEMEFIIGKIRLSPVEW